MMQKNAVETISFPFAVVHDKKGEGKVVGLLRKDGSYYARVDFGNRTEDFIYPDQFIFHLKAKDSSIQKKIELEYAQSKEAEHAGEQKFFLRAGYLAGQHSGDIYDKYCKLFGWNPECKVFFGKNKRLYANDATPEGYSVWMPVHTNLCEKYNDDHYWFNFIGDNRIKEVWFAKHCDWLKNDPSPRVCFARSANGYQFMGVYVPEETGIEMIAGKPETVRTYKRISATYPVMTPVQPTASVFTSCVKESAKSVLPTELPYVTKKCIIEARIVEENKDTRIIVDISARPIQRSLLGKKAGDAFSLPYVKKTYQIKRILEL